MKRLVLILAFCCFGGCGGDEEQLCIDGAKKAGECCQRDQSVIDIALAACEGASGSTAAEIAFVECIVAHPCAELLNGSKCGGIVCR